MHVDGSQFLNHFHRDCENLLEFVPLESLLRHCQRCLFARSYVPRHEVICVSGSQYCSSLQSSWVCNIKKFCKHLNFLQHICAGGSPNMSGERFSHVATENGNKHPLQILQVPSLSGISSQVQANVYTPVGRWIKGDSHQEDHIVKIPFKLQAPSN